MTVDIRMIYYLAGLLEGEGCFTEAAGETPCILFDTTDQDTATLAAKILQATRVHQPKKTSTGKPVYRVVIRGAMAAGWMMTLYSLLSQRRRSRIRRVLDRWQDGHKANRPDVIWGRLAQRVDVPRPT